MRAFCLRFLFAFAALVLLGAAARAHEAETSYLRLRLQPGVLEVRVTFDAFTLGKIAPGLDANADEALSKAELAAATPAIQRFIRENVTLALDGKSTPLGEASDPFWPLDAPDPLPATRWHDNGGLILFPFDLALERVPSTARVELDPFPVIGDRHRFFAIFEHAGRSQPVILNASRAAHVFSVQPRAGGSAPGNSAENSAAGGGDAPGASDANAAADIPADQPSSAAQFFWEGIVHILEGYDHIAFLLALLLAASRLRDVVLIVTAFTVAHSITLILAARGVVQVPARLVECAIAATIVYVAVENLARRAPRGRWALTFAFGLIHGFGFANVLAELTLPPDAMITSLLLFNVGVEAGQLALVLVLWPILRALGRAGWGRKVMLALNVAIGLLGLAWLADRVLELDWMPF